MSTSRAVLKSYFESGKFPTEAQFAELIDSLVHGDDDLSAVLGAMATLAEVQAATATDKYMNPFLTKEAIDYFVDPHRNDTGNPHQVDKTQVGLGNLPNAKSDSISLNDSNTLATSKAAWTLDLNKMEFVELNNVGITPVKNTFYYLIDSYYLGSVVDVNGGSVTPPIGDLWDGFYVYNGTDLIQLTTV